MKKPIYTQAIKRNITLTKVVASGAFTVEIQRPHKRKWVTRKYKPTASSLERVKRIVGYKHGHNGWSAIGTKVVTLEYWRYM